MGWASILNLVSMEAVTLLSGHAAINLGPFLKRTTHLSSVTKYYQGSNIVSTAEQMYAQSLFVSSLYIPSYRG